MSRFEEKYRLRRYRAAYGSALISITLVLFLLASFVFVARQAGNLSNYIRENIGLYIEISDSAEEREIIALHAEIQSMKFTKRSKLISKDEAAKNLSEELGEDFLTFIGYNPLPNSIELFLKHSYANSDSVSAIKDHLLSLPLIEKVSYQESIILLFSRNIRRIGVIVLVFIGLLLVISIILIHNSIRLAIYAKRLIIKSMLLVGATQGFIRRPFLINGILQGAIGGIAASAMMWALLYLLDDKFPDFRLLNDLDFLRFLSAATILFGVLVSWLSNLIAIKKYLKINSEELY